MPAAIAPSASAGVRCCRRATSQPRTSHRTAIQTTSACISGTGGPRGNYFCKTCGIFTYIADGENGKDGYRVNLGCVEGLDPLALDIRIIDGKSVPLVENSS